MLPDAPRDSRTLPAIAVCMEFSIHAFGGTEVLVGELVRGLSSSFAVTLVSADPTVAGTWAEPHVVRHIQWSRSDGIQPAGERLARQLKEAGVELAHFHCGDNYGWAQRRVNQSPILAVSAAGIRCLTTNHGFFSPFEGYCAYYRPGWMKAALFPPAWLSKMQILRTIEREIAVSKFDLRGLRRWYSAHRGKFRQIYHSQIHEGEKPGEPGPRRKTILCVGTFGSRKGQPDLAEAFGHIAHRYRDWNLIFAGRIGQPEIWKRTERAITAMGLQNRVQRLEGLSHAQIAGLMRDSEILVMPSLFEGLGLSLQEALFHGCACVATRCGGPEDLIQHEENGLLVHKSDPLEMAAALERLITDEPLRQRLRERAPKSIAERKMTAEEMVRQYESLYRELLATPPAAGKPA